MQKRLFPVAAIAAICLWTALAPNHVQAEDMAAVPRIPAQIDLQDGDTFVFLGDSITHQRLYTQYVEDFFYQRYPDRRIRFHNAGIGGARAWDARARISRDVLNYKPRYVSVLLGMNDGSYQPFAADIFSTYQQDMTSLVDELRDGGAIPILMSPTMFDSRAARLQPNSRRPRSEQMLSEYNSVLAYYGRWLQDQAIESGTAYVDMFSLLNDLTLDARETNPEFTLIKDAIHPDPPGQVVMAYAMIDDLGLRKPLSSIRIEPAEDGFKATAMGGSIQSLSGSETELQFNWTANALPWVLPEEAQPGVSLLKLGHRATKEALEVHGLEAGSYHLLIDGINVGTFTDVQLSRHIELQDNSKTPQYQQAMSVAVLNKEKNEGPVKALRDGWRTFQSWARHSRDLKSQPHNDELVVVTEKERQRLSKLEDTIIEAEAAAKAIEDKIYTVNQPVTRHYILRRTTSL